MYDIYRPTVDQIHEACIEHGLGTGATISLVSVTPQ